MRLPNIFDERIPQNKWKTIVKASIKEANEIEVKESLMKYKKFQIHLRELQMPELALRLI